MIPLIRVAGDCCFDNYYRPLLDEKLHLVIGLISYSMMQLHYLEIVTNEVNAVCDAYSRIHGVVFGEPDPNLGNSRTATMELGNAASSGVGIRPPMHAQERPVVRPYTLTSDIMEAVKAAVDAGATVAVPPMQLGGDLGTCAIVMFGNIESGFWQLE